MHQSARTVAKFAHFWSDTRNTQWHEIKGAVGKQSKRYECQFLRNANTVWRNPGMTTDDVCLMFTWALKIAPGFPIHVGKIRHDKGKCTLVLVLFRQLPNVGIQNFGMWGMYTLVKAYRSIENPLPIAESMTGKPAMVTLKIQFDCSMVLDTTLWANIFVRSHLGCGTDSVFLCLCRSHKYFEDAKAMQINRILKIS